MTRIRKAVLLPATLALLALALPLSASAAEAAPRWRISQFSFPTTLVPGSAPEHAGTSSEPPTFTTVLTNVGGADVSGTITVTETLPEGIKVPSANPAKITLAGDTAVEAGAECEEVEASPSVREVLCEVGETVASGKNRILSVPLEVSESAPSPAITRVEVSGGGARTAAGTLSSPVSATPSPFGLLAQPQGLFGGASDEEGLDASLAGSHPYVALLEANLNSVREFDYPYPSEGLKDLELHLPRGLVVNPQAPTVRCAEDELAAQDPLGEGGCPAASQIGQITVMTVVGAPGPKRSPLYAMQPPPGVAAEFGFYILGALIHIQGDLDGDFHLTGASRDILAKYVVLGIQVELWGDPAAPGHDEVRFADNCPYGTGCSISPEEANKVPFVTMPASCHEALTLDATARSWEGSETSRATVFSDAEGNPLQMSGCNALEFKPTISSKATTNQGDSPTGLDFSIHQPQSESLGGRSTAPLKDATVTLPAGMSVNPAGAGGLGVCTESQMDYAPTEGKVRFLTTHQSCPGASKIGTVQGTTPLLDHKVPGSLFLAKPYDNPFGSLLALYLTVEDEQSGIVAKLAGKVSPDPNTGQLTASFTENPELPLQDIELHVFNGPNATLMSPLSCGTQTTNTTLTPWSSPEGADAHPADSFATAASCSSSEAEAPKDISFTAGTTSPLSGAYAPFELHLSRPDGSQRITGVKTTLPEGLLGRLAGASYCPESGIAVAKSREAPEKGKDEIQSPSCPGSSELGSVAVSAGAGPDPISASGHVYLAGPYGGAPLSMVAIVPAVTGPFDLGTVVNRIALNVDPVTAQIKAVSDPLPTIREGVPFDVRSISLKIDRPEFTLNPTSCEAMAIEGQATTAPGQSESLQNRFQVGECGRLAFKPHLTLRLKGATRRAGHPKLIGTIYSKGGEADPSRLQVKLPRSAFLDQAHIRTICTRVQFSAGAGNGSQCPPGSVYGHAWVKSPLLDYTLSGPVLLRSSSHKLPDLVMALQGPSYQPVQVEISGKTDSVKGALRNTFEAVPDAPFSQARLVLYGGKRGLVVNSRNLCAHNYRANVRALAHN